MKPEDFGLTKKDTENIKDIIPTYNLAEALTKTGTVRLKVIDDAPHQIAYEDKGGKKITKPAITVLDIENSQKVTLWLSAKTLQAGLYHVSEKHGGKLKDVIIKITTRPYEHPVYGKNTKAYVVTEETTA